MRRTVSTKTEKCYGSTPGTPASSPWIHLQTAHIQLRPLQASHPHTPHKEKEQIRNKSHNFVYDLN